MSTADEFQQCQAEVKQLTTRPSNEDLLTLYATFKQASDGDVTGKRPGMLDIKGRAKYDAWAGLSGQSTEDAQQGYIDKVRELQG
jgi:acyl-CoA-binding protein